jgi:long-chain acyl-CoA synthetase
MLIHHFLEESARRYPDKVALIHEDVRAKYGEINNRANELARGLMGRGVAQGDRVVLLMENSLEYVIAYYGVLKSGAVAVPLSTDLKPDGLKPLLAELEPKAVISSSRCERLLQATDLSLFEVQALLLKGPKLSWSSVPFPVYSWDELLGCPSSVVRRPSSKPQSSALSPQSCDSLPSPSSEVLLKRSAPDATPNDTDLATIIYTSGSTGKPKGVMLSHRNIISNTHSICGYLQLTEQDIQMVVLPFFYVMGKSLLNTHFAVGATVVINNKFAFPATVINQMVDERVTSFSGVPSTYAYLLYRSPLAKFRDRLGALRYCSQAGGHMSDPIKQELRRVLPEHTKIYIMYGATEASARLTYLDPERFEDKMSSIGKPIPGVTLKVLGHEKGEVSVGQSGELVGQGPNIMLGYWKDNEGTAKVLDKHGYHTGDFGHQDADGYFFVTGRKDNLLKVGGHRINPQEVEDALMGTQLAIEAVVLGQPDALLGHRLVALACPKNGDCSESLILNECLKRLPRYKVPSEVKLLRSLPKNTSGKIDRARCLELFLSAED